MKRIQTILKELDLENIIEEPLKFAKFNPSSLCIDLYDEEGTNRYEIDLERCLNSNALMDWIFHIRVKSWCTHKVLSEFLECLDRTCILYLHNDARAIYCQGYGKNNFWKEINRGKL